MVFSAVYAASRYSGIDYGTRGPAIYASTINNTITAADSEATFAAFHPATSEFVMGMDSYSPSFDFNSIVNEPLAGADTLQFNIDFNTPFHEAVGALDFFTYYLISYRNIFAPGSNVRQGAIFTENRAGQTYTYQSPHKNAENRRISLAENNRTAATADNRKFTI